MKAMKLSFFWEYYPFLGRKKTTTKASGTEGYQGRNNGSSKPVEMGDKWTTDQGGKDVETKVKGVVAKRGGPKHKILFTIGHLTNTREIELRS